MLRRLPHLRPDTVEHLGGEAARLGVLAAGMIGGDQRRQAGAERIGRVVGERGRVQVEGGRLKVGVEAQRGVEGHAAQRHHDPQIGQQRDLSLQEGPASGDLGWQRLVVRRRTAADRADEDIAQGQTVVAMPRGRLAGESGAMQRRVQEVAGAVAGEHAARAIRAVCGRRQADHQHARVLIAEAGHRLAPVLLIPVRAALDPRHLLAPRDEARAAAAGDDCRIRGIANPAVNSWPLDQ